MMHPHDSLASLAYSDSKHSPESGRDIQFPGNGGLVLSATQFGDPKSPQVLLLHGGGQTRHAWAHTATALARSGYCATCIAVMVKASGALKGITAAPRWYQTSAPSSNHFPHHLISWERQWAD